MSRSPHPVAAIVMLLALAISPPSFAQEAPPENIITVEGDPDWLVLDRDFTIDVTVGGIRVRLEVDPGHTGPLMLNPEAAIALNLRGPLNLTHDFGGMEVQSATADIRVDFGSGAANRRVSWSTYRASNRADGVIGIYDLPYERVTLVLGEPSGEETVQRFDLEYRDRRTYPRLGIVIAAGDEEIFVVFSNDIGPNFISARTANFLATHHEGAFVPDSAGSIEMWPGLHRPTRDMRLGYPLELGDMLIDTFAVRLEDYGRPNRVGEMEEDDPRFNEEFIFVSRRRGRGSPDVVSRIGRNQIAHCSRMTFDLEERELRLHCASGRAAGD